MIITEYFKTRSDGVKLFRTYSDENRLMLQNETGIKYAEAIDVEGAPYTYTETEEFIESDMTEIEEKARAYDVLMGAAE